MGRLRFVALFLLCWPTAFPASADIDPSAYELKTSVRSEQERNRLKAIFEADMKAEAEQRKQAAEDEAQRIAKEKAVWELLPYPVRLVKTRCTACHIAGNFKKQQHNRIGWELVVLRMQYLNAVKLGDGERSVIAAHLAQAYPVAGLEAVMEALLQFLLLLPPAGLLLILRSACLRLYQMRKQRQDVVCIPADGGRNERNFMENDDANRSR